MSHHLIFSYTLDFWNSLAKNSTGFHFIFVESFAPGEMQDPEMNPVDYIQADPVTRQRLVEAH